MKTEFKRYFIELSYNGSNFSGWQRQNNASTVQQTIEEGLSLLLGSVTEIVGCGRTDTCVHANSYFAHFDTEVQFEPERLVFKLNSYLSQDIGVYRIFETTSDVHARFNATERTYRYFVSLKKNPFQIPTSHYIYGKTPNINAMNEAAKLLLGEQHFGAFEKIGSDNSTSICTVSRATWTETNGGIVFEITADRFLRNMVRAIVGTLLDVGVGETSLEDFKRIIESKDRGQAGASAPAKGLFLWNITYPNFKSYE